MDGRIKRDSTVFVHATYRRPRSARRIATIYPYFSPVVVIPILAAKIQPQINFQFSSESSQSCRRITAAMKKLAIFQCAKNIRIR